MCCCQLLVYGAGEVLPNTLSVIQPNMKYSLDVSVSERVRYGRLILVMDKDFCTDSAGNHFTRTDNSSFFIHFGKFYSKQLRYNYALLLTL